MAKPHVVIFPFMAQGHTLPLIDLAKALSKRGITVTIVTTPSNVASIAQYVANNHPLIALVKIPFPIIPGLPEGCENTTQLPSMEFLGPFLQATKLLQKPFENLLRTMSETNTLPICVISDFFLGFTLSSCQAFGVPRLVFHGMGVLSMAVVKNAWVELAKLESTTTSTSSSDEDDHPLQLPGLEVPFVLSRADLPDGTGSSDHDDPFLQFLGEVLESEYSSWGVVVNSFLELEGSYVAGLEPFYKDGAKAWCLGPLSLYTEEDCFHSSLNQNHHEMIVQWLDKSTLPVIYVSFGTQACIPDAQLDEVAYGLEESGFPYLWTVRSTTWVLPDGMEERLKGKGLITKKWVDQRSILAHSATAGFLSHCGWNSVLESMSAGVPILAWPMIAEQRLNARFVADGVEAGMMLVPKTKGGGFVSREEISKGVKELMGGGKGRMAGERAVVLGDMARRAVQEGGSSYRALDELIDQLCSCRPLE